MPERGDYVSKKIKIGLPKLDFLDFNDFLLLFGSFMLGKGIYMIYPPAMFIVVGLTALWLGWPGKVVK